MKRDVMTLLHNVRTLPKRSRRRLRLILGVIPLLILMEGAALFSLSTINPRKATVATAALCVGLVLLLTRSILSWCWLILLSHTALDIEGYVAKRLVESYASADEEQRRAFGTARAVRALDSAITDSISGLGVNSIMLVHDLGLVICLGVGAVILAPLTGLFLLLTLILAALGYLLAVSRRTRALAQGLENAAVTTIGKLFSLATNIREMQAMGRSPSFTNAYLTMRDELSRRKLTLEYLHVSARYYIEVVMFVTVGVLAGLEIYGKFQLNIVIVLVLGMRMAPAIHRAIADWTRLSSLRPALSTLASIPDRVVQSERNVRTTTNIHSETAHREPEAEIVSHKLSYGYPLSECLTFSDLNFRVAVGEVLVVTGEVGSGKSTLLDVLMGLRPPTRGEVKLGGVDAYSLTPEARLRVGLVSQQVSLLSASWRENLHFGLAKQFTDEQLWWALNQVRLQERVQTLDDPLGDAAIQLSGGERQLLGLARALLGQPSYLFLDEPTSNLDLQTEELFLTVLDAVRKNSATVVVTHRPAPLQLATSRLHLE